MDNRPAIELLESAHAFPGTYQFRAIGSADDDFVGRVIAAVQEELSGPSELDFTVRNTPNGRHVALSIEVQVQTAEQVRAIYSRVESVAGLSMLF